MIIIESSDSEIIKTLLDRERAGLIRGLESDIETWKHYPADQFPWFDRSESIARRRAELARLDLVLERLG